MTTPRSAWTSEELARVAAAEELVLAARRREELAGVPLVFFPRHLSPGFYDRSLPQVYGSASAPDIVRTESTGERVLVAVSEGEVVRPGDRDFFGPGAAHWHGAAPDHFMSHLAMQQVDDRGSAATWGAHVSDEEYTAAPLALDG